MIFNPDFNQFSFHSVGDDNDFMALVISSGLFGVSKGMLSSDGLQETTKSLNNGETLVDCSQKASGPVDERVKPSVTKMFWSADMVAELLRSQEGIKSDRPHIVDGVTFTSNDLYNDLLREGILYSRDISVYDYPGQGKSDTLGNGPIKVASNSAILSWWKQMYDAKLLPTSVSTTATVPLKVAPNNANLSRWKQMYDATLPPTSVSTAATVPQRVSTAATVVPQSVSTAATNPASGASRKRKAETTVQNEQLSLKRTKKIYVEPTENDVLFGRGGRSNHHPGNKRYHEEKLRIQPRYKAAERAATTSISLELVNAVYAWGGRFLKLEDGTKDKWYEVSKNVARKKASQALREVKENNLSLMN